MTFWGKIKHEQVDDIKDKVEDKPESPLTVGKRKWKQPAWYSTNIKKEPEIDISDEQRTSTKKGKRRRQLVKVENVTENMMKNMTKNTV